MPNSHLDTFRVFLLSPYLKLVAFEPLSVERSSFLRIVLTGNVYVRMRLDAMQSDLQNVHIFIVKKLVNVFSRSSWNIPRQTSKQLTFSAFIYP